MLCLFCFEEESSKLLYTTKKNETVSPIKEATKVEYESTGIEGSGGGSRGLIFTKTVRPQRWHGPITWALRV